MLNRPLFVVATCFFLLAEPAVHAEEKHASKAAVKSNSSSCDVGAVVVDPDPSGLNVRASPSKGKVLGSLPRDTELRLRESRGRWVRFSDPWNAEAEEARDDTTPASKGNKALPEGWVYTGLLSTFLKTPDDYGPDTKPRLREQPREDSPASPIEWKKHPTLEVTGCKGLFLKVKITTGGEIRSGWLGGDSHCASTVTTCS